MTPSARQTVLTQSRGLGGRSRSLMIPSKTVSPPAAAFAPIAAASVCSSSSRRSRSTFLTCQATVPNRTPQVSTRPVLAGGRAPCTLPRNGRGWWTLRRAKPGGGGKDTAPWLPAFLSAPRAGATPWQVGPPWSAPALWRLLWTRLVAKPCDVVSPRTSRSRPRRRHGPRIRMVRNPPSHCLCPLWRRHHPRRGQWHGPEDDPRLPVLAPQCRFRST